MSPATTRILLLLITLAQPLILWSEPVALRHSARIGDGIVWFYPEGVDSGTLPSLALTGNPQETGPVPDDWQLVPAFEKVDNRFIATIRLPEGSDIYGSGEVRGPLRRNGRWVELWNTDNFAYAKYEGKRLYQSHPWILGLRPDGRAFGLLFDSSWRALLKHEADTVTFSSEGPPFRVILIDRKSPQAVLSALAELTGYMPLPPRWALGFQQSKWGYYPDARVREIADEFRARNLPCDVVWMDIDYMDGFRVFTFDPEHFPDPAATNAYLHKRGFKSVWMIDPGVKREKGYSVYDSGAANNAWVLNEHGEPFVGEVWPGECVFPDFTRPQTRAWWADLYKPFMATGIDGVWNDMNEPSVFDGTEGTMDEAAWHRGGGGLPPGPHARYHNVYGMLMVKASVEGIRSASPEKRPFVLTRANFLGGHRYAATWTGDNRSSWDHLKMSIPMSLNLGLSGQPFSGPDIGGFSSPVDPVLYGHWFAVGAFYPFSRAHSDKTDPFKEPWAFGPEIERVAQTALFRRYRLLPYLYTQMESASRTGVPVMQPVFFGDPADPALRHESETFLFGPDLMVIPQWDRFPKMPKGNWRKVRLLSGEREADAYQPELRIREGAIIPLGKVVQSTVEDSLDPLTLMVSLDVQGHASGWLYEDAGNGYSYREGDFARSRYIAERSGDRVLVRLETRRGERCIPRRVSRVQLITDLGILTAEGDLVEGVEMEIPLNMDLDTRF